MSVQQDYEVSLKKRDKELGDTYDVMLGDMPIGYITQSGNKLVKIEIHKSKRGNGYGKEAVKLWVEENRYKYRYLETTAVIDDRMVRILDSLGFSMIGDTGNYQKYVGE